MSQTLIVDGMHCDACKMLVKMELEDAGIEVYEVELTGDNQGEVVISSDSDQDLRQAIDVINNGDNNYQAQSSND